MKDICAPSKNHFHMPRYIGKQIQQGDDETHPGSHSAFNCEILGKSLNLSVLQSPYLVKWE